MREHATKKVIESGTDPGKYLQLPGYMGTSSWVSDPCRAMFVHEEFDLRDLPKNVVEQKPIIRTLELWWEIS